MGDDLKQRGLKAGLITNDQSVGLVDTARVQAAGQPVEEVTGGCFCCEFDHMLEAAQNLTCGDELDVLIAEPVGSCTDIRATVGYPLHQLFGDRYQVAPISVMVDPIRCAQALGEPDAGFSEKVVYIYRKQLEEADVIVVNKVDLLTPDFRSHLKAALQQNFPEARVVEVSCKTGEGLNDWFDLVLGSEIEAKPDMEVDYDIYAEGEARLGWLNTRASFVTEPPTSGNELMSGLLHQLKEKFVTRGLEIAHAKVCVESGQPSDFGSVSLVSNQAEPQVTWPSEGPLERGTLTLNLRAEADPDLMRNEVMTALFTLPGCSLRVEEMAAFRSGRPTPTHRLAAR